MRLFGVAILIVFLALAGPVAYAQRQPDHHNHRLINHSYRNTTKVSRGKGRIICPVFFNSGYPYQAVGFKIGDPFALTYKFYPNKKFSIDADFGKSASGLYNRYYRQQFDFYTQQDTLPSDASLTYLTHEVKSDWMGELKFAYQVSLEALSPGLQLYGGLGWQIRSTQLQYDYLFADPLNDKISRFSRSRFTQGANAVIGVEYSYFTLPISAFIEVEMYNDLDADPGWRHTQGGIGIRYVF
jgi:hypothetical protein